MSSDLERLAEFAAKDPVYQALVAKHVRKKPHTIRRLIDRSVPEYKLWANLIQRCTRDPNKNYGPVRSRYAARGITVCATWRRDYRIFLKEMGPRPSPQHILLRISGSLLYSKSTCRWGVRRELYAKDRE